MSVQKEGTITFRLEHEHEDWATNSDVYRFPTIAHGGISVDTVKHSNKTVEIKISGLLGQVLTFRHPIPPCDARGLFVAITWRAPQWVKLYLNGKKVETQQTN